MTTDRKRVRGCIDGRLIGSSALSLPAPSRLGAASPRLSRSPTGAPQCRTSSMASSHSLETTRDTVSLFPVRACHQVSFISARASTKINHRCYGVTLHAFYLCGFSDPEVTPPRLVAEGPAMIRAPMAVDYSLVGSEQLLRKDRTGSALLCCQRSLRSCTMLACRSPFPILRGAF